MEKSLRFYIRATKPLPITIIRAPLGACSLRRPGSIVMCRRGCSVRNCAIYRLVVDSIHSRQHGSIAAIVWFVYLLLYGDSLTHITITVSNIERSGGFYASFCGLSVVRDRRREGGGTVWLGLDTPPGKNLTFLLGVPSVSGRGAGRDPQEARGSNQNSSPKGPFASADLPFTDLSLLS